MQIAALPRASAESHHHHLLNTGLGAWHVSSSFALISPLEMGTVVTSISQVRKPRLGDVGHLA